MELSGLAGLNTGDERWSKPVVEKAANTQATREGETAHKQSSLLLCSFIFRKCAFQSHQGDGLLQRFNLKT